MTREEAETYAKLRRKGNALALAMLGFLTSILALFAGLVFLMSPSTEELRRVSAPDGTIDAVVLWVYGGGAAGYSDQYLYLTPVGEPAVSGEPALSSTNGFGDGFRLSWRDERTLIAGYPSATGAELRKTYRVESLQGNKYSVEWWSTPGTALPSDAESTP